MFHLILELYRLLYLYVINPNLLTVQLKLLDMVLGNMIYGLVVVNVAGTVMVFSWLRRPCFQKNVLAMKRI